MDTSVCPERNSLSPSSNSTTAAMPLRCGGSLRKRGFPSSLSFSEWNGGCFASASLAAARLYVDEVASVASATTTASLSAMTIELAGVRCRMVGSRVRSACVYNLDLAQKVLYQDVITLGLPIIFWLAYAAFRVLRFVHSAMFSLCLCISRAVEELC